MIDLFPALMLRWPDLKLIVIDSFSFHMRHEYWQLFFGLWGGHPSVSTQYIGVLFVLEKLIEFPTQNLGPIGTNLRGENVLILRSSGPFWAFF